jgi:ABC-2 type transport system permease protein
MRRTDFGTLLTFARQGWRRSATQRAAALGLLLLYWLILLIFWGLWHATSAAELTDANVSRAGLFWYLIVTECIALSVGIPFRNVESEINNGDIAAGWMRPIPYALATLSEWAGHTLHRFVVLAIGGTVAGVWMTGSMPIALATLPILAVSVAIACTSMLLCHLQIGYAAAWVTSSTPLFWIWQKLSFVFGGLLIPLSIYPPTLQHISLWTPFAGMLFAPASLVFGPTPEDAAGTLAAQLAWLLALGFATWAVDRAVATRFALRGI